MSKPEVFIIESLNFADEKMYRFEGKILFNMLKIYGKNPIYFYIRTKKELIAIKDIFNRSDYRYLHLSCHGNNKALYTTLDKIDFLVLSDILDPCIAKKRLFISACSAVNSTLANCFNDTDCLSITGPNSTIEFNDAAIVWASFYHLMFKCDHKTMNGKNIKKTLDIIYDTYNVKLAHYSKVSNSHKYREYIYQNTTSDE